jgi:hypothetical protein
MLDLRHDPRWLRLNDPLFLATGVRGGGFDLDVDRPAAWTGGEPVGGDDDFDPDEFLSADLCIIANARFFVRGVVELPILGGGGKSLAYAIWAEVSHAGFGTYFKSLEAPEQAVGSQITGNFANRLQGFPETLGQACSIRLRAGNARPLVTLNAAEHPLAREQARGVTLDRMLDLYAAIGLDLRPALGLTH